MKKKLIALMIAALCLGGCTYAVPPVPAAETAAAEEELPSSEEAGEGLPGGTAAARRQYRLPAVSGGSDPPGGRDRRHLEPQSGAPV